MGFGTPYTYRPLAPANDETSPMLAGNAHAVSFSTCMEVEAVPSLCWDVNGYYRLLGFSWPYKRITRRSLFEHYRDLRGADDAMMTNAFKLLLDPDVRREYDRLHLGDIYVDRYVEAWLLREAKLKASRMAARAAADGDPSLFDLTFDAVMRMAGFTATPAEPAEPGGDEDVPLPTVDTERSATQDATRHEVTRLPVFLYGFYQWRTKCADLERLAIWRDFLIAAFSEQKVVAKLAVGFHGRMAQKWLLGAVGNRLVVYLLDDEQPTSAMARAVVDRVVLIQQQQLAKRAS